MYIFFFCVAVWACALLHQGWVWRILPGGAGDRALPSGQYQPKIQVMSDIQQPGLLYSNALPGETVEWFSCVILLSCQLVSQSTVKSESFHSAPPGAATPLRSPLRATRLQWQRE